MKKSLKSALVFLVVLILFVTPVSALSPDELEDYGQISYDVVFTTKTPKVDGVISNLEYGNPIARLNYGDKGGYWYGKELAENDLSALIPDDVTLYLTFDTNNLYIAATCIDSNHKLPAGTFWDGDSLEFSIALTDDGFDSYVPRTRFTFGLNDNKVCGAYYASVAKNSKTPEVVSTAVEPTTYKVKRSGKKTTYEAALPWATITGTNGAPEQAISYFQFNCADSKFVDQSDYNAFLGYFRCAVKLSKEDTEKFEKKGGEGTFIYNVLNFRGNSSNIDYGEENKIDEPIFEEETDEPQDLTTTIMIVVIAAEVLIMALIIIVVVIATGKKKK